MAPFVQELSCPKLSIPVTIDAVSAVMPAGPLPVSSCDALYLSNLDDMPSSRVLTPTVYFYSNPMRMCAPARVLRRALEQILIAYYPLSGRLREAESGKLEVFFGPEQGAVFVEAHTEAAMADLGDLDVPNPAWWPLLYRPPAEKPYEVVGVPLLTAQVTVFSCGGFSLGLRLCHCLCDGAGAMQLVAAWASTARAGEAVLSPEPRWDREFFRPRDPPAVRFAHREFELVEDRSNLRAVLARGELVQRCYRMSREFQARLKRAVQSGDGACTTFDSVAAHVWRAWARALGLGPAGAELRLTFSVNLRPKLADLGDGFYGNAVCVGCASSKAGALASGGLAAAARLVGAARSMVTEDYARSAVDYVDVNRPERMEFAGKLTLTQWTRFGLYESADFGSGRPVYAGPLDLRPTPQCCVFLPDKPREDGAGSGSDSGMLLWICLPVSCVTKFRDCLLDLEFDCEL